MQRSQIHHKSKLNMLLYYKENDFLKLGLTIAGYTPRSIARTLTAANRQRFEAKFYACPETCRDIFWDLQVTDLDDAGVDKPNPTHLLMTLNYLKEYPIQKNFAGTFHCSVVTARKWVTFYIKKIEALRESKIKWLWDQQHLLQEQEKFIITVDGVHCRTCEPRTDPSAKWYTKKHNCAGFSYELGVAIFHNQLCWINGPFPAGENDMKIFKKPNSHSSSSSLSSSMVAMHLITSKLYFEKVSTSTLDHKASSPKPTSCFQSLISPQRKCFGFTILISAQHLIHNSNVHFGVSPKTSV